MIAKVTRDLHAREVDRVHGGEKGMTEIANRTGKEERFDGKLAAVLMCKLAH